MNLRSLSSLLRVLGLSLLAASLATAKVISWSAPGLASPVPITLLPPDPVPGEPAQTASPVVFYLTGLPFPRVGTDSDEAIIGDLRNSGNVVAVMDFHGQAFVSPNDLAPLFVQLRADLQHQQLLPGDAFDRAHMFIVPAGCRLLRDVPFYVAPERTLAFDLIYPSAPAHPVGTVIEFSCDNAERMGNFSLDFCTDTVLPLAALHGHAAVMADHPVDAPYKGFDAMPESGYRARAAVQTLRAVAAARHLPLNDRVVAVGFSRGSGMALLLATTTGTAAFLDHGEAHGPSADICGAVVMSGRFTYLDLLPDDKMIPRYNARWGTRAESPDTWQRHGALDLLTGPLPFPLFLTINVSEGADALHQMEVLRARLDTLHSSFSYEPEMIPRGHKMPVEPKVVAAIQSYLSARLAPDGPTSSPSP